MRACRAAATAPVALATPALAQALPEVRWRVQSSFPRVFDVLYGTLERISARVAASTIAEPMSADPM